RRPTRRSTPRAARPASTTRSSVSRTATRRKSASAGCGCRGVRSSAWRSRAPSSRTRASSCWTRRRPRWTRRPRSTSRRRYRRSPRGAPCWSSRTGSARSRCATRSSCCMRGAWRRGARTAS
ncbi:hypothetical protein LTR53_019963, partial [Teratosphaeriaceae sp. CCFEE 6253]